MDRPDLTKLKKAGMSTWIKLLFVAVLIVFLFIVYRVNDAEDIALESIENDLKKSTDITELKKCNTRELLEYIGIDYSDYDEVLYYKSKEALDVKEVLIVKAEDKLDLVPVQDAVESRIEDQITTYRDYAPKQVAELNDAVITKRGNYLFYCVAEDPEKYEGVFRHAIQ